MELTLWDTRPYKHNGRVTDRLVEHWASSKLKQGALTCCWLHSRDMNGYIYSNAPSSMKSRCKKESRQTETCERQIWEYWQMNSCLPSKQTTPTPSCLSLFSRILWTLSPSPGLEVVSLYSTKIPPLWQAVMRAFSSLHWTVDSRSIFPAARRRSMMLGMEKFTADLTCEIAYSLDPRQSITMEVLSLDRNFARSHSFDTNSHSHSASAGIVVDDCQMVSRKPKTLDDSPKTP